MKLFSRIYIAGHSGLVGSALCRHLLAAGYNNLITIAHNELDLTRQLEVESFFMKMRPEYCFLAAAKVGGIGANSTYPADFIYQNLAIQTNIIHSAYLFGVKKLLFLGSSCIYPRLAPQPLKEEYLLTSSLEPTNEPYAIAKIAGLKMCQAYNTQYGTHFISVMPTNLYGPNDNFDLENSHVLPALIRKFHEAKMSHSPYVEVWGTGQVRREFLFIDDLAEACLFLMNLDQDIQLINIGIGQDLTISELASLVKEIIGYQGEIKFNPNKPDGALQKLLDISKLENLGWSASTTLLKGIKTTYQSFLNLI